MPRWSLYRIGQRVEVRIPTAVGYQWFPAVVRSKDRSGRPTVAVEGWGGWKVESAASIRALEGDDKRERELAGDQEFEAECREAEADYALAFRELVELVMRWNGTAGPSTIESMDEFVDRVAQKLATMRMSATWLREGEAEKWQVLVFKRVGEEWVQEGQQWFDEESEARAIYAEVSARRKRWAKVAQVAYRIELQRRPAKRKHFMVVEISQ